MKSSSISISEMAVLRGRLERGVPGEHTVDVALVPAEQVLDLLRVSVGRRLHQLLSQISGDVSFKELFQ